MQELYIDTPAALTDLCRKLADSPWLAVDTEFLRERTYYPRLCLIQLANEEVAACIDPLALPDLEPLRKLLLSPTSLKVFHATRQDLEILFQLWGEVPAPLFDTQLAAALLGLGDQAGYASVVERILGVTLEKGQTRADWRRRPLPEEQRRYALDDVIYLGRLYLILRQRLQARGRDDWLDAEFTALADPALYRPDPSQAWQRVRGQRRLRARQRVILQALARWRETRAMETNRPRKWVMKDEVLLEIARRRPDSLEKLAQIRGLERGTLKRHGHHLLHLLREAERETPATPLVPQEKPTLDSAQETLVDLLMVVLRLRAATEGMSPEAVANRAQVARLVAGDRRSPLLQGWRHALVGAEMERMLRGGGCLRISGGRVELTPSPPEKNS